MNQKIFTKGLLSFTLFFCSTNLWAYDFEVDSVQYTVTSLDEMTVEVSGYTTNNVAYVTEVTIPETVEYKDRMLTVTSIGESAFSGYNELKSVTLPNTIITISSSAFRGCTSLSQIALPDGLQSMGSSVLRDCTSLAQIDLPKSLNSIGSYAFSGSGLKSIEWPNSITKIGSYCFAYCESLSEVNLPPSLESIGGYAFYYCTSLKELYIPDDVTSMDSYALHGCTGLETLNVGVGLTYLYDCFTSRTGSYRTIYLDYCPIFWEDGPSELKHIILRDVSSNFSVRGYGTLCSYESSLSDPYAFIGYPMFSNINVGYYYVGRPLIDIDSWTYYYSGAYRKFRITISQPYGTINTLEISGYCTDVPYFYQSIEYLVLGENVETYETGNIYQGNLKGIICRSAVPPTLSGTFDNSNYVNTIVYVPIGSKAIYEATEGWKDFWDIQELDMLSIPPGYDAVESVTAYGKADVIGYYSIDGKKFSTPQRGINIIRYSDGTTKKVLVK